MGKRKKEIINIADIDVEAEGRLLLAIASDDKNFETYIGAGSTGTEVVQALAIAIDSLVKREQKINPEFTSEELLNSIKIYLRILGEKR